MLAFVDQWKNTTQLRWNRIYKFQNKVKLNIEFGSYVIKTAENSSELIESFKLRDEVFNQEFRGTEYASLDFDRYDYHFDHLIILHKETQKIIGTYRLNCSRYSKESYTALEFDLSGLDLYQAPYLELGRACIAKEYRKGAVISLLWRGIAEYMNASGAQTLFGCSSLKINNARDAALVYKRLVDTGHVVESTGCSTTRKFKMKDFDVWYAYFQKGLTDLQAEEAENLMPSLLKSYLKLGAKVVAVPAFDQEFDCIDLLTVLRKEELSDSLAERLKVRK